MKNYKKIIIVFILITISIIPVNSLATEIIEKPNIEFDKSIGSEAFILIEYNSGQILCEKNAHKKMYPASTTKMMTAILALENCILSDKVTIKQSAIDAVPARIYKSKHKSTEKYSQ